MSYSFCYVLLSRWLIILTSGWASCLLVEFSRELMVIRMWQPANMEVSDSLFVCVRACVRACVRTCVRACVCYHEPR